MNGAECKDSDAKSLVREVEELCGSDVLSLDALRGKLDRIPRNAAKGSTILHRACMNAKVSLEVIECILGSFPNAAHERTTKFSKDNVSGEKAACPLHLACHNKNCPCSVIELLMELSPEALQHFCLIGEGLDDRGIFWCEGLPLHYYLQRASAINIDTVKIMVNAYPEALEVNVNTEIGPVHAVLSNYSISGGELHDVLDYFSRVAPQSLCAATDCQETPLHFACKNSIATPRTVQLLVDSWPESIAQQDSLGMLPLHELCWNDGLDDTQSIEILSIFVKAPSFPRMLQLESEDDGFLPIHLAAEYKSSRFCEMVLNAYPELVKIMSSGAGLPIHAACRSRREDSLETVKLLFEVYPEGIRVNCHGNQPLYEALRWGDRNSGVVGFLLSQDAGAASKPSDVDQQLPLHTACEQDGGANFNIVRMLFDAYPKALRLRDGRGRTPLHYAQRRAKENEEVVQFLEAQLQYALKARRLRALTTIDSDGRLPLHQALYDKASLGSIKLLANANPTALRVFDNQKMIPLHIACEFSSLDVVQFLVELDGRCVNYCDSKKNTTLHHACRGGNCSIIKYVLEKDAPSVSQHNGDGKLPIQLLIERQKGDVDRGGTEYVEAVWSLLLAHPETAMKL